MDDTLILAILNKIKDDDDDDDDEWVPLKNNSPKPQICKKRKIIDIKIKNPKPIYNINDLITVLEETASSSTSKRRKKLTIKKAAEERETLISLIDSLVELRDLIGMKNVKEQIVNQILLFMQNMNDSSMFLHTVLTGNPGCGKTTLCKILAKIYKNLGFLTSENVIIADRSELIGQWLGETSIKTKKILDSAKGGILLIDEAYSLGSKDGRDSFSKECIDCINQYLSENADDLVCIIAGYKEDLEECFFKQNRGLERRFPWRYNIDKYTVDELYDIFKLQVIEDKWELSVDKDYIVNLFNNHPHSFKNNGGDTKNLLDKCKVSHAQRVFGSKKKKKKLIKEDIEKGLKEFSKYKSKPSNPPMGMYL